MDEHLSYNGRSRCMGGLDSERAASANDRYPAIKFFLNPPSPAFLTACCQRLYHHVTGGFFVVVVVEEERGTLAGEVLRYPRVFVGHTPDCDVVAAGDGKAGFDHPLIIIGLRL
jgi:hypothetical protein